MITIKDEKLGTVRVVYISADGLSLISDEYVDRKRICPVRERHMCRPFYAISDDEGRKTPAILTRRYHLFGVGQTEVIYKERV